jgi:hypothetical protein
LLGTWETLKLDESCISNPKSEIFQLDANILHHIEASIVQSHTSDFGFEMQDSSNFKIYNM